MHSESVLEQVTELYPRARRSLTRAFALALVPLLGLAAPLAQAQFAEDDVRIIHAFEAEGPAEFFGYVSERLDDLDGDGVPELVITAPANGSAAPFAGRVYVYSGRSGGLLHVVSGEEGDQLGTGVSSAGDVDADGVGDYVIGGYGHPTQATPYAGRVLVVSGATHEVIHDIRGGRPFQFLGYEVAGIGDVDGDGFDDFATGTAFSTTTPAFSNGEVIAYSGFTGEELWRVAGREGGDYMGSGLTGLSIDVDGDGVRDVLATGSGAGPEDRGAGRLLSGRTGATLRYLVPTLESARSFGGFFAHDAGDVDGDGVSDLYVSDYNDAELGFGSGRVWVFSGRERWVVQTSDPEAPAPLFELARPLLEVGAKEAGEGFGIGRGAGDLDGDGFSDLVVAGYLNGSVAEQGGKVYLISGATGETLRTMTGNEPFAQLGFDALIAGDLDRDGIDDVLITGANGAYVVAGARLD